MVGADERYDQSGVPVLNISKRQRSIKGLNRYLTIMR